VTIKSDYGFSISAKLGNRTIKLVFLS